MVSYEFYKNDYLGSALTEDAFKQTVARAEAWLETLSRKCCVLAEGPDSRAMAVCAVADAIAANPGGRGVQQQSIGGVSIRYADPHKSVQQRLLQAALLYVDIYRGVD